MDDDADRTTHFWVVLPAPLPVVHEDGNITSRSILSTASTATFNKDKGTTTDKLPVGAAVLSAHGDAARVPDGAAGRVYPLVEPDPDFPAQSVLTSFSSTVQAGRVYPLVEPDPGFPAQSVLTSFSSTVQAGASTAVTEQDVDMTTMTVVIVEGMYAADVFLCR